MYPRVVSTHGTCPEMNKNKIGSLRRIQRNFAVTPTDCENLAMQHDPLRSISQ